MEIGSPVLSKLPLKTEARINYSEVALIHYLLTQESDFLNKRCSLTTVTLAASLSRSDIPSC